MVGQRSAIWVDGVEGGGIPGDDPGLLLGLTVFETLRTYDRKPFRLAAHLDRLELSARAMEIAIPARDVIEQRIYAACESDVYIRYTFTAGGHEVLQIAPIALDGVGAPVTVACMDWVNPSSLPGGVKHGARASWVLAARRARVDEVLLVDPSGFILEANRSNVFAVVDGELCTPPLDGRQLAGVTRSALLEAASVGGLPLVERPIHVDENIEELYLASTLKELAPVLSVDGKELRSDGAIGSRLHGCFRALVHRETGVMP